jgi:ABC-2 type transport system ATP-binding protein
MLTMPKAASTDATVAPPAAAGVAHRATPENSGTLGQPQPPAITIRGVGHRYGPRVALNDISLDIASGEIFAVLGPNGGGKTTLFRLLSTLIPVQQGEVQLMGHNLATGLQPIRRHIGVVFQSPSLDRKLTVAENVRLMGRLYGLSGPVLDRRVTELLEHFGVRDRAGDLVEQLSGGLKRRVELAKSLVHQPPLLLLDEPTTGLDPAARSDVWQLLTSLRNHQGTTIVFTTHYLDEADVADRLAILDAGRLVALGQPDELRRDLGGDSITLETDDPRALAAAVSERFGRPAQAIDGSVRLEAADGHRLIAQLVEAFPHRIRAVHLGKPSLEDVFIAKTGRRFSTNHPE